ncbi:MAG: hypothetical protein ABIM99_03230 [Candidatus Dojkabacteria bacterium]
MSQEDSTEVVRYDDSIKRIDRLKRNLSDKTLDSFETKLLSMVLQIAFTPENSLVIKDLIGIEKFETISRCLSFESMNFLLLLEYSGLFGYQTFNRIPIENKSLISFVGAWNSCRKNNFFDNKSFDIDSFLKSRIDYLVSEPNPENPDTLVTDRELEQQLIAMYGVEF